MKELIGRKINAIYLNETYLKFDTDKGILVYTVYGDCCSLSVFYDFYGVKTLLKNKLVTNVKKVELHPTDIVKEDYGEKDKKHSDSLIQFYGFQITTESPEFGEQTSVVSFRNYSNGYYGGTLNEPTTEDVKVEPQIFDDVIDTFKLQ